MQIRKDILIIIETARELLKLGSYNIPIWLDNNQAELELFE